ncbi:MAG: hypothetical protein AB8H86_24240 [Polyangiales bacterium]
MNGHPYSRLVDAAQDALGGGLSSAGPAPFALAQTRLDSGSSPRDVWCARLLLIDGIKAEERTAEPVYHSALAALNALLRHRDTKMNVGLDADFADAANMYVEHQTRINDEVTRGEWATRACFELQPFYFERHSLKRGRRVKAHAKTAKFEYAFDALDKLRLVRTPRYEAFIDHGEEDIRHLHYDANGQLVHIQRYEVRAGKVVKRRFFAKHGVGEERYTYEGACLVRIDGETYSSGRGWATEQLEATYDADGSLRLLESVYECLSRRLVLWESQGRA